MVLNKNKSYKIYEIILFNILSSSSLQNIIFPKMTVRAFYWWFGGVIKPTFMRFVIMRIHKIDSHHLILLAVQ